MRSRSMARCGLALQSHHELAVQGRTRQLQLRRPREGRENRLERREEPRRPEAPALREERRHHLLLSHRRREVRRRHRARDGRRVRRPGRQDGQGGGRGRGAREEAGASRDAEGDQGGSRVQGLRARAHLPVVRDARQRRRVAPHRKAVHVNGLKDLADDPPPADKPGPGPYNADKPMRSTLARLGVALPAAAFLGYWALLVYCEVWRPSPFGLQLNFDAGRTTVVDAVPGGPAAGAGLRAGDRVAAFGGHPINGRLDWMAVEANLAIGRPTQLSIERAGAVFPAALTPEHASWQSWRSQQGPKLLVVRVTQLVTILLALTVAITRSRDSTALVGAAFLATVGVFSLALPNQLASVWRTLPLPARLLLWIPYMSSVSIAAWGFSFFAIFPRGRYRRRLAWCAVWMPLVPGLAGPAGFGYHVVVMGQPAPPLPPWSQSLVVLGIGYLIAGLVVLVRNYRRLTDVNERRRVRVVMVGSLIGVIAGATVVLPYWQTPNS